jgi:hypothetical protein
MRGLEGISFDQGACKVIFDASAKKFTAEMKTIVKDI